MLIYRNGVLIAVEQVFFESSTIHIRRLKNGIDSTHYLAADELSELTWLRNLYPKSKFLFCSRLLGPLAPRTVQEIVAKAGATAGFEFPVHPHMLRHSKGHQLANRGTDTRAIQEYLGHKNINHTVRYTSLSPDRFKDFGWADLP